MSEHTPKQARWEIGKDGVVARVAQYGRRSHTVAWDKAGQRQTLLADQHAYDVVGHGDRVFHLLLQALLAGFVALQILGCASHGACVYCYHHIPP